MSITSSFWAVFKKMSLEPLMSCFAPPHSDLGELELEAVGQEEAVSLRQEKEAPLGQVTSSCRTSREDFPAELPDSITLPPPDWPENLPDDDITDAE